MAYVLKGGLAWLPEGFRKRDILLEDGKIKEIGDQLNIAYAEEIDCRDCYLIPGVIDFHVHNGEPAANTLLAEDERLISLTCKRGGVTTIGTFITETERETIAEMFPRRKNKFKNLPLSVNWHLTPVRTKISSLKQFLRENCDLKLYTTYKEAGLHSSYKRIEEIFSYLAGNTNVGKEKPVRILIHCEDNEIIEKKREEIPFKSAYDHALRRPEIAEIKAVERVLELAVKYNYPVHIVHVSSPRAALLIREAQKSAPISCETAPHYLLLNEDVLRQKDGHRWLCTPPLRAERSRGEMVELAQEGLFDIYATDHCPFTVYDKDRYAAQPDKVPMGLPGTGALLPIMYEELVKTGKIGLTELIERLTVNPAKLLGIYPEKGIIKEGSVGDLLIFQETGEEKPIQASVTAVHNPWKNRTTSLSIKQLFRKGELLPGFQTIY